MSRIYDNWERLVTATLRREHLRISGQRTPSEISSASLSSFSSFNLISSPPRVSAFNFSSSLIGYSFSYHEIFQATDYLSDSNLIKHGRSGDLYYGVLGGGIPAVIKKIDLSSEKKESLFISELEILGKVSHHRLVPLLGHCLENGNEKFLVYKRMSNEDLSTSLSRKIVSEDGRKLPFLDWRTKLKIATEAAEVLSFLHHECVPPLVHRDIQASSILLDDKFEVRLGSLSQVCAAENDIRASEQSTYGISNANYAYDVYSFGKVLLELVCGKPGITATNDSTMKDWMENALAYILPDYKELVVNIVGSSLARDKHYSIQIWAVAFIAEACLSSESSKRPQMKHILLALEYIKSAKFTTHRKLKLIGNRGSDSPAEVIAKILEGSQIVGKAPLTAPNAAAYSSTASRNNVIRKKSDTKAAYDITRSNLTVFSYLELVVATRNFESDSDVTGSVFGLYQARLLDRSMSKSGSESLAVVRKLYSQNMPVLSDFQFCISRICSLGGLSHPNLVKFLGYCLEDKELFLVHEFMRNGSLENHLFRTGSEVQSLSWDIRLKILIGAARGLAFLHASTKQGFYEYFGTSDILLDGSYTAKISGFGMTKIVRPARRNITYEVHPNFYKAQRYVYGPPESDLLIDFPTGHIMEPHIMEPMKSDVYGFGVVLVEMLTGLSAKDRHRLSSGACHLVPFFRFHMDPKHIQLEKIIDPWLEGKYSSKAALKIGSLAVLCLDDEPDFRPSMKIVVDALESVISAKKEPEGPRTN